MKKHLSILVQGKNHEWAFDIYEDPKYLEEWREDGLEIDEVVNTVPEWAVNCGLTEIWIFVQDVFNFKFLKR